VAWWLWMLVGLGIWLSISALLVAAFVRRASCLRRKPIPRSTADEPSDEGRSRMFVSFPRGIAIDPGSPRCADGSDGVGFLPVTKGVRSCHLRRQILSTGVLAGVLSPRRAGVSGARRNGDASVSSADVAFRTQGDRDALGGRPIRRNLPRAVVVYAT
jgi:hypothetical protein